jgi:hypothetical protein
MSEMLTDAVIQSVRTAKVKRVVDQTLALLADEIAEELFCSPETQSFEYVFMQTIPSDVIGLIIKAMESAKRNPKYDAFERRLTIDLPRVQSECPDVDVLNAAPTSKVQAL